MAERGVVDPPVLGVILLGKTGQGKSTTGNKLIDADGNNAEGQASEGILSRLWPRNDRCSDTPLCFDASDGIESATKGCAVITNKATGFRVMDTRGFAPSDVDTNAYLANLQIIREVVEVSDELGLKYHKVLYFMPERDIPCRADAYLQEELAVLWHFFGKAIFKNMVIVVTVSSRYRTQNTSFIDEFGEGAKHKVETIFSQALKNAIHSREAASLPPCPSIVFISHTASNRVVADIVRDAEVREPNGINLEFQSTTCCKCASVIYFRKRKDTETPAGVEEEVGIIKLPEESHCHPVLIPKHSKLVRITGTVVHILAVGTLRIAEVWRKKQILPSYFGTPEEKCASCEFAPRVKGCMKVGSMYKELKVEHEHKQRALKAVDS